MPATVARGRLLRIVIQTFQADSSFDRAAESLCYRGESV
jgi:hypothetical protein